MILISIIAIVYCLEFSFFCVLVVGLIPRETILPTLINFLPSCAKPCQICVISFWYSKFYSPNSFCCFIGFTRL